MAKKTVKKEKPEKQPKKQAKKTVKRNNPAGKKQTSPLLRPEVLSEKSETGSTKKSTESKNKLAALKAKILREKQEQKQQSEQEKEPKPNSQAKTGLCPSPTPGYLHSILSLLPYYMLRFFVQRTGGKIRDLDETQRRQLIETGTPVISKYMPDISSTMPEEINYIACLGVCGISNYEGRLKPEKNNSAGTKADDQEQASKEATHTSKPAVYEQGSATVPDNDPEDVARIIPGPEAAR